MLFQTTTIFRKPFFILFIAALSLSLVACQESPPPEPETVAVPTPATTTRYPISTENGQELLKQQEERDKLDLKQPPSFPGGAEALGIYLKANLKYPEQEKADGITENILMNFTVQVDGTITDVKNMTGENQNLIDASFVAVENMPKWEPAIGEDGEPTKSSFMIPINWTLKDKDID